MTHTLIATIHPHIDTPFLTFIAVYDVLALKYILMQKWKCEIRSLDNNHDRSVLFTIRIVSQSTRLILPLLRSLP